MSGIIATILIGLIALIVLLAPAIIYWDATRHNIGQLPEKRLRFNFSAGRWAGLSWLLSALFSLMAGVVQVFNLAININILTVLSLISLLIGPAAYLFYRRRLINLAKETPVYITTRRKIISFSLIFAIIAFCFYNGYGYKLANNSESAQEHVIKSATSFVAFQYKNIGLLEKECRALGVNMGNYVRMVKEYHDVYQMASDRIFLENNMNKEKVLNRASLDALHKTWEQDIHQLNQEYGVSLLDACRGMNENPSEFMKVSAFDVALPQAAKILEQYEK